MRLDGARARFAASSRYLDTASVGVPCRATVTAMREALDEWSRGRARPPDYDRFVEDSRQAFASLVATDARNVAVGSQVSVFVGLVASALPPGSEVLCPEGEFTSVLFPFLARGEQLTVRTVPLEGLADAVRPATSLVAFSLVQSVDGRLADTEAIAEAARRHQALTLADATQACGWLPVEASRFDLLAAGAYKWLLAPRGTAFMTVRPGKLDRLTPILAGWYAGEDVWESIYGRPLRLAHDARRLDVSPAWLCWVGTAPALRCILDVGVDAIHRHDVALANRFRQALKLPPSDSAIVSLPATDRQVAALQQSGIRASIRAGRVRLSFHLYNDAEAADAAAAVLRRQTGPDTARR